jgi:DNA polymerase-1
MIFSLIILFLELREQEKKISSFGADYLKHIHPKDGRIHTDYNQLGTYTGRLSSSKPNLQQIPRSQDYRKAFVAKPGYKLIAVDFSQQEYRLVGAISGEQTIIDAYKAGKDMHAATASIVNNIPIEQVTKEQRNRAKSINFAILYGSTEYGLAFNLQIPVKEARQILENFYSGYPTLKEFKTYMESMIVEKKYSVTVLGRRRYWEDKKVFADGEEYIKYNKTIAKEGFNHTIQGSGADATKIALCNIFYNNPFGAENLKILLQVHDEIVCEVKEDLVEEGTKFIVEEMEKAIQPFLGEIPAIAEPAVGDYWIH